MNWCKAVIFPTQTYIHHRSPPSIATHDLVMRSLRRTVRAVETQQQKSRNSTRTDDTMDAMRIWTPLAPGAAMPFDRPSVFLESTVIAQGLPWPENLETALAMVAAVQARVGARRRPAPQDRGQGPHALPPGCHPRGHRGSELAGQPSPARLQRSPRRTGRRHAPSLSGANAWPGDRADERAVTQGPDS